MLRRTIVLSGLVVLVAAPAASGGGPAKTTCRRGCGDTAAPSVAVASPATGSTVSGTVAVAGTASDNAGLASVDVSVDGTGWTRATGTASWSFPVATSSYADGGHTLYARATDTSGNASVASITVTFANADTTAPTVAITSPAPGATISGTATVTGSAGDDRGVTSVAVSVDGGAWQPASGTSSWSYTLNTATYPNGTHTITARATDAAGHAQTTSRSVTVGNTTADTTMPVVAISSPAAGATATGTVTVSGTASDNAGISRVEVRVDSGVWAVASGTSSWSYALGTGGYANGSHTITARATDTSGNVRTAAVTVTVSNTTGAQHWVSPEGLTIDIDSAGPWTVSQIYQVVKDNAAGPGDFAEVAPHVTVKVQDVYASSTRASASTTNGVYTSFGATIYLLGNGGTFPAYPDSVIAHEYGHAWTMYHLYLERQGDWSRYLAARWTNADGSVRLASDARLDSSYMWMRAELVADDYRLLFGTPTALQQQPTHLNWQIVDPRNVTGLRTFFLTQWA